MRIAVDIDDVIIDLAPVWLGEYNRLSGESLTPGVMTQWNWTPLVKDAELLYSLLDTPIWQHAMPVRGAGMAIYRLLRAGHDIVYVTAQYNKSKVDWMIRHGYITEEKDRRFVVASDKSLISADMLIDDKPENVIRYPKGGIIFARPWNDIGLWPVTVERIDGWPRILDHFGLRTRLNRNTMEVTNAAV